MKKTELNKNFLRFGYYASIVTAVLTILTFTIAILTPPLSGPFCTTGGFVYPFYDIAGRFPRDYYWMYPAMILSAAFLVMIICIYQTAKKDKKHFGLISVSFAIMATIVLIVDYFLQVSVIQPSILAGETDGVSILSQFNPHGVFIALEEIGFIFMNISLFALIPVFPERNIYQKAVRWVSFIGFVLIIISFTLISLIFGINREYRFEVAAISITWLELIILGLLYSRYFKKLIICPGGKSKSIIS